jgi:hypothetical protein
MSKVGKSLIPGNVVLRALESSSRFCASAAWSPERPERCAVRSFTFRQPNTRELQVYRGKLEGAVVIFQQPADLTWQASSSFDSASVPIQRPAPPSDRSKASPEAQFNTEQMMFFKDQGVAAVLRDSDKLRLTKHDSRREPVPARSSSNRDPHA